MPRHAILLVLLAAALMLAATAPAPPSNAAKAMVGKWEFSNADRDKLCTITFKIETTAVGMKLEFDPACADVFPFVKEIVAWRLAENDFLRLLDAKGRSLLEFSEVESGMYEAPRPGEGILFIQTLAAAAPPPRTSEQVQGEWTLVRRSRTTCTLTLLNAAASEGFALKLNADCEPFVLRFNPVAWHMDRGELVLFSARGESWRFEETDANTWRRVPETADPVLLVRK